jgi:hypothetical protein
MRGDVQRDAVRCLFQSMACWCVRCYCRVMVEMVPVGDGWWAGLEETMFPNAETDPGAWPWCRTFMEAQEYLGNLTIPMGHFLGVDVPNYPCIGSVSHKHYSVYGTWIMTMAARGFAQTGGLEASHIQRPPGPQTWSASDKGSPTGGSANPVDLLVWAAMFPPENSLHQCFAFLKCARRFS